MDRNFFNRENGKKKYDICKAFADMKLEGVMEGRLEGKKEGKLEERQEHYEPHGREVTTGAK